MDKSTINQRFIDAINFVITSGMKATKGEISEVLKISPSKFSEILNNRMNAGTDLIAKLCDSFGFDSMWLLTGQGSMLRKEVSNVDIPPQEDCEGIRQQLAIEQERLKDAYEEIGGMKYQLKLKSEELKLKSEEWKIKNEELEATVERLKNDGGNVKV